MDSFVDLDKLCRTLNTALTMAHDIKAPEVEVVLTREELATLSALVTVQRLIGMPTRVKAPCRLPERAGKVQPRTSRIRG